jgi:hypothetical protein
VPIETLTVGKYYYKISSELAMENAQDGDWCLCLDEVRANALPENKKNQISVVTQWLTTNNCYGCSKIIESNDPEVSL